MSEYFSIAYDTSNGLASSFLVLRSEQLKRPEMPNWEDWWLEKRQNCDEFQNKVSLADNVFKKLSAKRT